MDKDIFNKTSDTKQKHEDIFKSHKMPYKKNDMWWLKQAIRALKNKKYRNNFYTISCGGSGRGFGAYCQKRQRVIFKMSYSDSIQTHKRFLTLYMPQEHKEVTEKPDIFGIEDSEYEKAMSTRHFKLILSCENSSVPLETLTKSFIKRVETLTNYKLLWKASIHKDTAHRHVHILINGMDKDKKPVRFPKEMIRTTMREIASYVATQLVGERTENELLLQEQNLIKAMRWTSLDNAILQGKNNSLTAQRLSFLYSIGLAQKQGENLVPVPQYQEVLQATGRYNTYFAYWQKFNGNLEIYTGEGIKGKVIDIITFDRDESYNDAIIVKSKEGKNTYIPVWQLKKENLIGKQVQIAKGNKTIARQVSDEDIKITNKLDNGYSYN